MATVNQRLWKIPGQRTKRKALAKVRAAEAALTALENAVVEKCKADVLLQLRNPLDGPTFKMGRVRFKSTDPLDASVEGNVTAQNDFGARLTSSFHCHVEGEKVITILL